MKPKNLLFPIALILSSSAMAGQFIWTGATNSTWTTASNWDLTTSPPASPDLFPVFGSTYAGDFLGIRNNTGADAVYNPGPGVTTTFSGGRCFTLGVGSVGVNGNAGLTVSSGTIAAVRSTNVGSEPYMANRANSNLLINGGALDLSGSPNNFRLIQEGQLGITSTITITSGSLSCALLDLVYDAESDPSTVFGTGVINLDGGVLALNRFNRTASSDPGQTSFTINLNGGTLRCRNSNTNFLPALADTQTIVKAAGGTIDTNSFNSTIAEALEHDSSLGATPDGGITKTGSGNLTLNGDSTFTGGLTINGGRIIMASDTAGGNGAITLAATNTELQIAAGRSISNPLVISDNGDLKTLLFVNTPGSELSGPITINESNIDNFRIRSDADNFLTLSGKISGPGGIYKFQAGWLTLTNGTNDFTGGTKVTQGTLSFVNGALGSTGPITMAGGSLRWAPGNGQNISSRLVMENGTNANFIIGDENTYVTFDTPVGNNTTATLVKQGAGWLTLSAANTYTGGSTATAGILNFFSGGLGTTGPITMNGGTLRWGPGNNEDISSRLVMVNGKTADLNVADSADFVTFASAIGNASTASLVKSGAGTLRLTTPSTYSGSTRVNFGTLALLANAALPAGSNVSIGSATLNASTFTNSAGTLEVTGPATINLGTGVAMSFANSSAVAWTGTLNLTGNFVSGSSLRFGTNASGLSPTQLGLITAAGYGSFALDANGFLTAAPAAGGYTAWAASNAPTGTAADDYDSDGVTNAVEYVVGGTALTNDLGKLPTLSTTGGNLVLTFLRDQASIDGTTTVTIDTSTTLTSWPDSYVVPDGAVANNPGVTVIKNSPAGFDTVTLSIPQAPDARKFARLKVTP